MLIPLINQFRFACFEDLKASIAKDVAKVHIRGLIIDRSLMLRQTRIRAKDFSVEIGR